MVNQQGGHLNKANEINSPKHEQPIFANDDGFIEAIDTLSIGWATVELGCGRKTKSDILDPTAGIEFYCKIGDHVEKGDPIFRCFNSNNEKLLSGLELLNNSIRIGANQVDHILFYN